MSYLIRHGSTWYFRWRIGQVTLKASLNTGNRRKAGLLARRLHVLIAKEAKQDMDENRLRRALARYRETLLQADEERRYTLFERYGYENCPSVKLDHFPPDEPYDEHLHELLFEAVHGKDFEFLRGLDGRFRDITGVDISALPEKEANRARYFTGKELLKVMEIQSIRKSGPYTLETMLLGAMAGGTAPAQQSAPEKSSIPLSDAIAKWEASLINEGKNKTTRVKYHACAQEFLEIIGDIDLVDIKKNHAKTYKDNIVLLPAKYRQKFKNKSIAELVKMKHAPETLCTSVSLNDKLNVIKQFMAWAVDQGYMETNFMVGIVIKVRKRNKAKYAPFTTSDIKNMFGPEYLLLTNRKSWHFWIPILSLFTGARQGELAQLKVFDIEQTDGLWVMYIRRDEDDEDSSVKTEAGIRAIPLHPFLIDSLKFHEYINARKTDEQCMAFDIKPAKTGGYGKNVSKWFLQTFLKKITLEPAPAGFKKKFHSLRSTACTALKHAQSPSRMAAQMIGHIPPELAAGWTDGRSMTFDYYGGEYPITEIYKHVTLKIQYPVDLTHLTNSPWTGAHKSARPRSEKQ